MKATINENDCGCATCGNNGNSDICAECSWDSKWEPKPLTNSDRIRAMTDYELAAWMMNNLDGTCRFCIPTMRTSERCDGHCVNGITAWLKQPAKEG